MPEDLTVKDLRIQLSDIQCHVEDFLSGNCSSSTRLLLSHHDPETPQIDNLLKCNTTCLSQSALQSIETKLLRLLLTRLASIFRLLITSTSNELQPPEKDTYLSQLVHHALDIIKASQQRPLSAARPRTAGHHKVTCSRSIPVINADTHSRPTSRLSSQNVSDQRSPVRSSSSRLSTSSTRKFHPTHSSLRSRTRTISRRSSTSTVTLPSNDSEDPLPSKVRELEEEIDSLKKNELLLLTYPDPYGPCSTRPSGDTMLDMRMQIIANKLRVQLLEKQSKQLTNVLQERRKKSSSDELYLPLISMASHSSFGLPGLSDERSSEVDMMTYDYGLSQMNEGITARPSLSSVSTKTAGTGDSGGGRSGHRMRSSLLGVKSSASVGKSGGDTSTRKMEEPVQHTILPLKTTRLLSGRIASAHKKQAAVVPLPRFR